MSPTDSESMERIIDEIVKKNQRQTRMIAQQLTCVIEERDLAVTQLNELMGAILAESCDDLLNGTGLSDCGESDHEDDEVVLTFDHEVNNNKRDHVDEQIYLMKMQLKHEIKLRQLHEKKSKR